MDSHHNDDERSFNIEVPKRRVFPKMRCNKSCILGNRKIKTPHEKRLRKPSDISLTKYCLPGETPLHTNVTKREELLLSFKEYAKKQHIDRHEQKMDINIRDQYKIYSTELRRRLHVDYPPNDVQTILDVDKEYFSCVDGRQLPYRPLLYKSLKSLFSDQLRTRQDIGYKKDCVLNIEYSHRREIKKFNIAVKRYLSQVTHFDTFISEDYHLSMAILGKWESLKQRLLEIDAEREHLANQLFTITSRLITLDFRYSTQQKYGRFLYYLSPPQFRSQNREFARSVEIEARGFDFGEVSEDDTFDTMFSKMKAEFSGYLTKPVLYFKESHDIIQVFGTNAQQQLHHLTHVMRTSPHSNSLDKAKKFLKEWTANDSAVLASIISDFEWHIEFYKERANQLEAKFFQVLNGFFYDSVGSPEVLKFHLHLEFCYEKVFLETPINMDMLGMGKAIESFYMDYSKRLDEMSNDQVRQALNQALEIEKIKAKKSAIAARELRLFERLEHELLLAFAPVPNKALKSVTDEPETQPRVVKKKVRKPELKPEGEKKKMRSLNESEVEYLHLFTDWTGDEDPGDYLLGTYDDDDNDVTQYK